MQMAGLGITKSVEKGYAAAIGTLKLITAFEDADSGFWRSSMLLTTGYFAAEGGLGHVSKAYLRVAGKNPVWAIKLVRSEGLT